MALNGTLRDFSVADIFQLIAQQQKSGALYVRTKEKEIQILFEGGKVVLGTFRKGSEDFLLGTMLLRAQAITAEQLEQAIRTQKATLRSLGDILKGMGAISPATLAQFFSLQLREVLFRLFQWKDGLYEFVPGKISFSKSIIRPQSTEGVVMDGFRMLDEWPEVIEKVGNLEAVFAPTAEPEEIERAMADRQGAGAPSDDIDAAFSEFDGSKGPSRGFSGLSRDDMSVLSLFDGHCSLQEIIYLSRLGTFETCKCAADLLSRGLIEKVSELSQTRVMTEQDQGASRGFWSWILASNRALAAGFFLSMLVPVVAFGLRSHWMLRYGDPPGTRKDLLSAPLGFDALIDLNRRDNLAFRIELYRFEHRLLPTMLEDLPEVEDADLWEYGVEGSEFFLVKKRSH